MAKVKRGMTPNFGLPQTSEVKTKYSIDKGVEIGGVRRGAEAYKKYPFEHMAIGDSFAIDKDDDDGLPHRVAAAFRIYNKLFNKKIHIVSRLQVDGSRRYWRIK